MAIRYSQLQLELREVDLKDKPAAMLIASPKATVPVLIDDDKHVIDESLDIMYWAIKQYDPDNFLQEQTQAEINRLILSNDNEFKSALDHYKYADRFEQPQDVYRQQGEVFLQQLEQRLELHRFLINDTASIADIAIFPFIRQFAHVDIKWFETSPYTQLHAWLNYWLNSSLFTSIMQKHPNWIEEQTPITL